MTASSGLKAPTTAVAPSEPTPIKSAAVLRWLAILSMVGVPILALSMLSSAHRGEGFAIFMFFAGAMVINLALPVFARNAEINAAILDLMKTVVSQRNTVSGKFVEFSGNRARKRAGAYAPKAKPGGRPATEGGFPESPRTFRKPYNTNNGQ